MDEENNNDEHCISLDLANGEIEIFRVSETPKAWPFGLFISTRTGTKQQMENLRSNLIMNNLKTLRHK
jgi:hypothetical protein